MQPIPRCQIRLPSLSFRRHQTSPETSLPVLFHHSPHARPSHSAPDWNLSQTYSRLPQRKTAYQTSLPPVQYDPADCPNRQSDNTRWMKSHLPHPTISHCVPGTYPYCRKPVHHTSGGLPQSLPAIPLRGARSAPSRSLQ